MALRRYPVKLLQVVELRSKYIASRMPSNHRWPGKRRTSVCSFGPCLMGAHVFFFWGHIVRSVSGHILDLKCRLRRQVMSCLEVSGYSILFCPFGQSIMDPSPSNPEVQLVFWIYFVHVNDNVLGEIKGQKHR
jgi:hypothetical protein